VHGVRAARAGDGATRATGPRRGGHAPGLVAPPGSQPLGPRQGGCVEAGPPRRGGGARGGCAGAKQGRAGGCAGTPGTAAKGEGRRAREERGGKALLGARRSATTAHRNPT
jgi:hypothetical protein